MQKEIRNVDVIERRSEEKMEQECSQKEYQEKRRMRGATCRRKSACSFTMPVVVSAKPCLLLLLVILLQLCSDCTGDLEPPFSNPFTLHVNTNFWRIHEDETVGTRIAEVRSQPSQINITYVVEASHLSADISDHFRVETKPGGYGRIILNKSFQGLAGNEYIVSVVGKTGEHSPRTRMEIRVRIERPTGYPEDQAPGPPKISQPFLPPPGAITPAPPPDVINNNFPPAINPLLPQSSTPSSSTKSFSTNNNFPSHPTTLIFPHDSVPTQPHVPRPNNSLDYSGSQEQPTSINTTPFAPTTYNVTTNDPHHRKPVVGVDNNSNNADYPEIPTNELGESANLEGKGNRSGVGVRVSEENTKQDESSMTLFTTILVVAVLAIGLIIATLYLVIKRNKGLNKRPVKEMRKESAITINSNTTMSGEGEPPTALQQWVGKRAQSNRYESWAPDAVPIQARDRWEFPRHHLQIGGILGEGCFGQVWRCEALNIDGKEGTSTVAVKTLKESAGDRERQDLLSELAVMKLLDPHANVVRLLGCCTEKDPTFVIMEFVALGKLQTYLRNSRAQHYYGNLHGDSTSLSSKDLTSFAYQVARGMEYLASKGIIHRDLAARNILIDKERVCKVADFGFARDIVDNDVYERKSDGRLPIRWMAPEALYDNLFTTKTDVWSFGVLMWEIVTLGSTPYPGMAAAEVMRKVRDGYRLEKPEHCRRELYNIMFYCWAHNSVDRPIFSDLVNFLSHLLFSETDYIELDRFPDHDYYNMASLSGEKL